MTRWQQHMIAMIVPNIRYEEDHPIDGTAVYQRTLPFLPMVLKSWHLQTNMTRLWRWKLVLEVEMKTTRTLSGHWSLVRLRTGSSNMSVLIGEYYCFTFTGCFNVTRLIVDFGKFSGGSGRLAQVLRMRPAAAVRAWRDQVRAISAQHSPPLVLQQRHDQ